MQILTKRKPNICNTYYNSTNHRVLQNTAIFFGWFASHNADLRLRNANTFLSITAYDTNDIETEWPTSLVLYLMGLSLTDLWWFIDGEWKIALCFIFEVVISLRARLSGDIETITARGIVERSLKKLR